MRGSFATTPRKTFTQKKNNFLLDDVSQSDIPSIDIQEGRCEMTFNCKYKTQYGQTLCIVGDIEGLGEWKKFDAKMHWSQGDIWKYKLVMEKDSSFEYKYIILQDGKG